MRHFILKCTLASILCVGCAKEELEQPENQSLTVPETENVTGSPGEPSNEPPSNSGSQNTDDPVSDGDYDFIATLTNFLRRDIGSHTYRSASLNGTWNHEFDSQDRLIKSTFFEKHPYRILKEVKYSDYSEDNFEVNIEVKSFTYFLSYPETHIATWKMELNSNNTLKKLIDQEDNARTFDRHTAQGWVTALGYLITSGSKLWTTNYEYDERGNTTKYTTTYHQYSMQDAGVDYTYNDYGDIETYDFWNETGKYSNVKYFYRADHSLERLEEKFNRGDKEIGTNIIRYNFEEAITEKEVVYEDGRRNKISYDYTNSQIIEEYFDTNSLLTDVYTLLIDEGQCFLSTHETYQAGVLETIRYFENYNILKEEFYDEDGNLEYTEYYDEDGNYSHTEQAS